MNLELTTSTLIQNTQALYFHFAVLQKTECLVYFGRVSVCAQCVSVKFF